MKVISWTKDEWKNNMQKGLYFAKRDRHQYERVWRENEKMVFTDIGQYPDQIVVTEENLLRFDTGESEVGQDQLGINYAWKYVRFLLSQMSSNPPSVIIKPTSTDVDDRRKADAADRIVRYIMRAKGMQEVIDQCNLNALIYGNGYIRTIWNPDLGDLVEFNEASGEVEMSGDFDIYAPSPWDIWLDYRAKRWSDVNRFWERYEYPVDEARAMFPEHKDAMDRFIRVKNLEKSELIKDATYDEIVEIYRYVERGKASNGTAGRAAFHLEDGTILGDPDENPHPKAGLGLHITGDSDVPNNIYNKTFVEYVTKLQDVLNRLDSTLLDNVEAHGVARFILPEGAEIEDEAVSNYAFDYIKMTGTSGQGPYFVSPPQLMPDLWRFRDQLVQGMQELAGINDSMLGQTKREMSGFSMQTAIDAGNTVRRRLFNKYTNLVESVYKDIMLLAQEHWTTPQTIQAVGKERAFETAEFSSADIDGGFDVMAEYGSSLSLDPSRRREEIQQIKPDLMEAGVSARTIVSMYRLNELDTLYDRIQQAAMRQREIFDRILSTGEQVEVHERADHQGMLEFCNEYVMTAEYRDLEDDKRELIDEHIKQREQMATQMATTGQGQAAPMAGQPAPEAASPAQPPLQGVG